jgi:hypothetical protein
MRCIKLIFTLLLWAIIQSTAAPTLPSNYHYDLSESLRGETKPTSPWFEDTLATSPVDGSRIKLWKRLLPSSPPPPGGSQSLHLSLSSSGIAGSAPTTAVPKVTWRQTIRQAYNRFRAKFIKPGQGGEKSLSSSIAKLVGSEGGTMSKLRHTIMGVMQGLRG